MTLLTILILIAVLATGACGQSSSGVVVSGQAYYNWSDWWGPFWGDLFVPGATHIQSDPGDWVSAVQLGSSYDGHSETLFGTVTGHHAVPRTTGAYEGYAVGYLSAGSISEFRFDVFAVVDQGPFSADHWGSNLLRLELWQVQYRSSAWSFDKLLWSSNGPWSITPQHAHVSLTDPYGIGGYAFRLAIVPEPGSFVCIALPLAGLYGWRVRAKRRAVES